MSSYKDDIVRIFKSFIFSRFAKKSGITDADLCKAVSNAEKGLIDADLGGGVIKQRVARQGQGKSGGFRTIILFKRGDKAFFVYGFAKNELENIDKTELLEFRRLAEKILNYSDKELEIAVGANKFSEVKYD